MKPADEASKPIKTLVTKPVLIALTNFGVAQLERFKAKYVGRDETVTIYQKAQETGKSKKKP